MCFMSIPLSLSPLMNGSGGIQRSGVSTPRLVIVPSAIITAVNAAGKAVVRIIEVRPVSSSKVIKSSSFPTLIDL